MGIFMQSCSEIPSSYIRLIYRSSIKPSLPSVDYTTDAGWGCMIRVAQMFIANYLHLYLEQSHESVLLKFLDNQNTQYSIQALTNYGNKQFGKKNFEWYTPAQAGYLIKHFLQKQQESVRVNICNDNCLFFKNIELDRPEIVLLLMIRIGLDQPQLQYLKVVIRLVEGRFFAGILGGKPKYAHYFVETSNNSKSFLYLDPHKTKPAIKDKQDLEQRKDEFAGALHQMPVNKIDPSMCVAFRFKREQFEEWRKMMEGVKQEFKEDFFIFMTEEAPAFEEGDIIEIIDDDDE